MENSKHCTLDDLRPFYEKALEALPSIKFSVELSRHTFAMCSLAKIFENTYSVIILLSNGVFTSINQILRNSLEAYVDLRNVCDDEAYMDRIFLRHLRDSRKSLEFLISRGNDESHMAEYLERLKETLQRIHEFSVDKKVKDTGSIDARFQRIGLDDLYRINYRVMSGDTHNSLISFQNAFMEEENGHPQISLFKPMSDFDHHIASHTAIWLLYDSMAHIKNFLIKNGMTQDDLPEDFQKEAMRLMNIID